MIRAIIFDFFGVFLPDVSLRWYNETIGEPPSQEFNDICSRSDLGEISREVFYSQVAEVTGISAAKVKAGIEKQFVIDTALIADVSKLHTHYRTALLSNATSEWVDGTIQKYQMTGLFDQIILSANVGLVKPDKAIFDYALNALGAAASETLFIDDREPNVLAARQYGLQAVLFVDRATLREQLERMGVELT